MTWSVFNPLGSIGQKKVNPLPVVEPVCGPEDIHVFGSHSDMCTYCGISAGWFSRHEGKVCNARIELRKLAAQQKSEKEQEAAVSAAKAAQLKAQLPFYKAVINCQHTMSETDQWGTKACTKCKATEAEIESAKTQAFMMPIDPMPAVPYIDYVNLAKSQERSKPLTQPTGRKFR